MKNEVIERAKPISAASLSMTQCRFHFKTCKIDVEDMFLKGNYKFIAKSEINGSSVSLFKASGNYHIHYMKKEML